MKARLLFSTLLLAVPLCACTIDYQRPAIDGTRQSLTDISPAERMKLLQNVDELSLEKAQAIALVNNPDFRSIQFTLDAARARYYQGFSAYAPSVNASMSISQNFSDMYHNTNGRNTHSQSESYRPGLSAQLLIFDCLAREMGILSAKYSVRQTQALIDDAKRLLLRAVAYSYNDILLSLAQRQIVLAEIDYSEKMLKEAQNKYKSGKTLKSDVLNFEITLKNGRLSLVKVDYDIMVNKYILAGYLGVMDGTLPDTLRFVTAKMPEEVFLDNVGDYIDQALRNRPDLNAVRHQLQAVKYNYWQSVSQMGPTLTGNVSLGYGESRSLVRGVSSQRSGSGTLGYGLNLDWNLFNGFSDYQNIKIALANVTEQDWQLAQNFLSVITDVRTAHANYLSCFEQAKMSLEICTLTRQTRDLVENEYKAGTALVTRLNEAESALIRAQNNLATAVINIENAKAQLDAAVFATQKDNTEGNTHETTR